MTQLRLSVVVLGFDLEARRNRLACIISCGLALLEHAAICSHANRKHTTRHALTPSRKGSLAHTAREGVGGGVTLLCMCPISTIIETAREMTHQLDLCRSLRPTNYSRHEHGNQPTLTAQNVLLHSTSVLKNPNNSHHRLSLPCCIHSKHGLRVLLFCVKKAHWCGLGRW